MEISHAPNTKRSTSEKIRLFLYNNSLTFRIKLLICNHRVIFLFVFMNTVAERMIEADFNDAIAQTKKRIGASDWKGRNEILKYLIMTGQSNLLRELFWLDEIGIYQIQNSIIMPVETPIYTPETRDTWGIIMNQLSQKELEFLLQSFYPNPVTRNYIIEMVFLKNGFIHKTLTDILDVMKQTEALIGTCISTKKTVLHIVGKDMLAWVPEAANDNNFTPLVDRIDDIEPWYFHYLHEAYKIRLHYAESLFCSTVAALAGLPENHLWAVDPENFSFVLPLEQRNHLNLIRSICEFHVTFDRHYPQLHLAIESTVAAWILIYKWFGAPAATVRKQVIQNHSST